MAFFADNPISMIRADLRVDVVVEPRDHSPKNAPHTATGRLAAR
jgi:hypothetical protein